MDEAWSLLERTEDESCIFKIVKTCRKFNLGLLLITQDVGDLLKNDAGKALLNNSEYTLLLRQKPSIIDQVEKTFRLSLKERERLLTAGSGEGILIVSNEHSEIKIIASEKEHEVITTNADELLERDIAKANDVVTDFEENTLDFKKGYYKASRLNEEEKEQLLNNGYERTNETDLYGGMKQEYLVKPRSNEGSTHYFVTKIIRDYICKYVDNVEMPESVDADIIFEYNGKKIAIEVETGSRHISRVEEKVEILKRKYGKDWFFVITDWNIRRKYEKLGRTYVRKEVPAILKKEYFAVGADSKDRGLEEAENKEMQVQNPCQIKKVKNAPNGPAKCRNQTIDGQYSQNMHLQVSKTKFNHMEV